MQVNEWGPGMWKSLHCITFNASEILNNDDRLRYENYFISLGEILPCKYCRESYKIYLVMFPIEKYSDTRHGLVLWLYLIHALVNNKINKPNEPFKDTIYRYENMRAKCSTVKNVDGKEYSTCTLKDKDVYENDVKKFMSATFKMYARTTMKILKKHNYPIGDISHIYQ
jgi:hypothetical protein